MSIALNFLEPIVPCVLAIVVCTLTHFTEFGENRVVMCFSVELTAMLESLHIQLKMRMFEVSLCV